MLLQCGWLAGPRVTARVCPGFLRQAGAGLGQHVLRRCCPAGAGMTFWGCGSAASSTGSSPGVCHVLRVVATARGVGAGVWICVAGRGWGGSGVSLSVAVVGGGSWGCRAGCGVVVGGSAGRCRCCAVRAAVGFGRCVVVPVSGPCVIGCLRSCGIWSRGGPGGRGEGGRYVPGGPRRPAALPGCRTVSPGGGSGAGGIAGGGRRGGGIAVEGGARGSCS